MQYLSKVRENVEVITSQMAQLYDREGLLLMDIAPQAHEGAKAYFKKATIETLDIDPEAKATYTADLTDKLAIARLNIFLRYDLLQATEVLEHVYNPFDAVDNIYGLLKKGGVFYGSVPVNLAEHGPKPDCVRFLKDGLTYLLRNFKEVNITTVESDRPGMPIAHRWWAIK